MIFVNTAATNGRYRDYNRLPLKQENISDFPKPEKGVSALLDHDIPLEGVHEEDSDEVTGIIRDIDFLDVRLYYWAFADIQWEDWKELLPFRKTEATPTTAVVDEIYKNIILGEILERLNVIAQREDNWDGLGSMKPISISLDRTKHIMDKTVRYHHFL